MPSSKNLPDNSINRCNLLSEILSNITIGLINIYRVAFSSVLGSMLGSRCRFSPTCSCYARDAFKQYGFIIGLLKTIKRVSRCRPWGGYGYDPIAPQTNSKRISRGI